VIPLVGGQPVNMIDSRSVRQAITVVESAASVCRPVESSISRASPAFVELMASGPRNLSQTPAQPQAVDPASYKPAAISKFQNIFSVRSVAPSVTDQNECPTQTAVQVAPGISSVNPKVSTPAADFDSARPIIDLLRDVFREFMPDQN